MAALLLVCVRPYLNGIAVGIKLSGMRSGDNIVAFMELPRVFAIG